MKIGFTGTRQGMTPAQIEQVKLWLPRGIELHDGDCIGADSQAFHLAKHQGLRTVSHPPLNPKFQAKNVHDMTRPPFDYTTRNHHIVDETQLLIATPKEYTEQWRGSGTWATIRYARNWNAPRVVIFPDGSLKAENISARVT